MSYRALRPIGRALSTARLPAQRAATIAHRSPLVQQSFRSFSISQHRLGSGEMLRAGLENATVTEITVADGRLSAAIAAEQTYEKENSVEEAEIPVFLDAFRSNGQWEIQDLPGADDVVLTRKFGNENIKITFQISDLDPVEPSLDLGEESAAANPEAAEETDESPILTASLIVSKPGHPNAMSVDLEASEDGIVVTNVAMFEQTVALAEGSEGDWARRSKYLGPQFEHLDPGVQEAFQSYLAERGVDDGLAQFIFQYAEYKEQRDYVSWLDQIKGFVDQ